MIPIVKFGSISLYSLRGNEFPLNKPIRDEVLPMLAIYVVRLRRNEQYFYGPYRDAYFQVWFHLALGLQRRNFFESVKKKYELPMVAMFVVLSGQNEQSL